MWKYSKLCIQKSNFSRSAQKEKTERGKVGRREGGVNCEYRLEPSCVLQACKGRRAEGADTEKTPSLALLSKTEFGGRYDGCRPTLGDSQTHSPVLHLHR